MVSLAQGRWARSHATIPSQRPAPAAAEDGTVRRVRFPAGLPLRPLAYLLPAAWVLPVLTHLVHADFLLILAVVYGTGGLLTVGGTVVDRLMITVGLLAGTAITAGIAFSFWPFGLNPVAVGGTALTILVLIGTVLRRRPRWPRRFLGTDLLLLGATVAGTYVAYGPARLGGTTHQLAFAALTGDRLRHFSLFDTIHRIGGYPFLMQSQARHLVDPGMLSVYPPGQHFLYALLDIFLTSHTDPGNPASELLRYQLYTDAGYGFFVLCAVWGARWVAGPAMAGWRRSFMVSAVGVFLCTGVLTTAIWCGWDPQVLGMGFLGLLAAVAARPPRGPRQYIVLLTALTIAIFLTYELFAPFAAIMIAMSAVVYRKRWWPHWRFALIAAVIAVPVSLSEIVSAKEAGLQSTQAALNVGFTIAVTKPSLAIIGLIAVAGFAARRARRLPSAVTALGGTLLCGCGVAAFWAYQHSTIGITTYYYEKAVEAWVVIALVGVGTAGHLLHLPQQLRWGWARRLRRIRIPSRGLAGAAIAICALLAGVVATDSIAHGKLSFNYGKMKPGRHTSWARVWMSGQFIYPTDERILGSLRARHMVGDGVPTLVVWDDHTLSNVNLSLTLAVLNHDDGLISNPVYEIGGAPDLISAGDEAWTDQQTQSLATLEKAISDSPVRLRIVVPTMPLSERLNAWLEDNPQVKAYVVLIPDLPGESTPNT
jgi:hypothetical protein